MKLYFNESLSPLQVNVSDTKVVALRKSLGMPLKASQGAFIALECDLRGLEELHSAFKVVRNEALHLATNNTIVVFFKKSPGGLDHVAMELVDGRSNTVDVSSAHRISGQYVRRSSVTSLNARDLSHDELPPDTSRAGMYYVSCTCELI
jgi:hypothetical protein